MDFIKFPRTPHLFVVPGVSVRDDKVMTPAEAEEFLSSTVIVEEKVDGANIGISFSFSGELQFQNRGNYVTHDTHPQFKLLTDWGYKRYELLKSALGNQYILFGEWCYLAHSIRYTKLPDWFIGFDVYEISTGRFLSAERRNVVLQTCNISIIPSIFNGQADKASLLKLLDTPSLLSDESIEGVYLRSEAGGYLRSRAKIVRAGFIQTIDTHWMHKKIVHNICLGDYQPGNPISTEVRS